jgi:transaldolase
MSELTELGIDIDSITKKLETDGVEKFIKAFDKLMETLKKNHYRKKVRNIQKTMNLNIG